jgi:alkylated DNA repair dioxygenase AlkB
MDLNKTAYLVLFRDNNKKIDDFLEKERYLHQIKNAYTIINYEDFFIKKIQKTYNEIFKHLLNDIKWKSSRVLLYGKSCIQKRLTCHMSDTSLCFKYSGVNNKSIQFDSTVYFLKKYVEHILNNNDISLEVNNNKLYDFNYCLLNLYNDGNETIGMHSDDESTTTPFLAVASLSLGETRHFDIHHKINTDEKYRYDINFGDIMVMGGAFQTKFKHGVPVQKNVKNPRISLTFRNIVNN